MTQNSAKHSSSNAQSQLSLSVKSNKDQNIKMIGENVRASKESLHGETSSLAKQMLSPTLH